MQQDAFEELLRLAGLDERDALPVSGSPLTTQAAARLLTVLVKKPVTPGDFPPRMAVGHLLREVLEGGGVSREELLRRVERFARVAVLRPDGYLAWVRTGRTQQKAVGRLEWKEDTFRAGPLELGRFYVSSGGCFRLADERMQPVGPFVAEVYDDADVLSRSLDGAQEAFFELAMAIGKLLTYPMDSLASLQHLPAGVAALIASSPEYFERFRYMTRGEQVQAVAKLTTSLLATWGVAGGTTRTLTGALGGAEATVPVLSLSMEGTLVLEHVAVPTGRAVTALSASAGGVYVLSSTAGEDSARRREGDMPDRGENRPLDPLERRVDKVVNSNMPHAAERAVERAGFSSIQEARAALQELGRRIEETGLPSGTVRDTASADRVIVPGFGQGGAVVYQVKNGVLKLKTVLEWRPK